MVKKVLKQREIIIAIIIVVIIISLIAVLFTAFNNNYNPQTTGRVLGKRMGGLDFKPNPQPLPKRSTTPKAALNNNVKVTAAPVNDNWPGSVITDPLPVTIPSTTIEGTVETNEPDPEGYSPTATVWYNWTAPSDGTFTINNCDANFDASLSIYTGSSLVDLVGLPGVTSYACSNYGYQVNFNVINGTDYYFQVAGNSTATGNFTLQLKAVGSAPLNDNWPGTEITDVLPTSVNGTNVDSTFQINEPANNDDLHTVWYNWISTIDGSVRLNTCTSDFDSSVIPYTGSSISNLTGVSYWSDYCSGYGVRLQFTATLGETYYFQVASAYDNYNVGNFTLALEDVTPTPTPTPTATPVWTNVALNATASASTEFDGSYLASNAIDGNLSTEWASNGELNPWIQLDWSGNQTVGKIDLYDRWNLGDDANSGVLTFSDGSNIPVTGIAADGTVKEVNFASKTITWVRFQVDGGSGTNVGLVEFEVFSSEVTPTPTPTPTPTISPTPTSSPIAIDDAPVIVINPRSDAERVETIQPTFTGRITDPDGIVGAEYLFLPTEQILNAYQIGTLDEQNWRPLAPDGGSWGNDNTFTVSPIAGSGLRNPYAAGSTSRTDFIEGNQFLYIRAWDSFYDSSTSETIANTIVHKSLYNNTGWIYYYPYGSNHIMAFYKVFINAIDRTAPDILSSSIVPNPTTDRSPSIHGYVRDVISDKTSNITSIKYKLDSGEWIDLSPFNKLAFDSTQEEFNLQLTNLSLGSHTLTVRAIDASGNDTDVQHKNFIDNFDIQTPTPSNAELISKIEDFSTRTMDDQYNTTGIWGNGRARARQSIQFNQSLDYSNFSNEEMGYLYGERSVSVFAASDSNHLWLALYDKSFAYYNIATKSVIKFTTLRDGINGNPGIDIRPSGIFEFSSEGKQFLAISYAYNSGVVFYDLNNTPDNTADDNFVSLEGKFAAEGRITINDLRIINNSVVLEGLNDPIGIPQVVRIDTHGTIMNTDDDTITNWNESTGMQHLDAYIDYPEYTISNINPTGILFDNSKDYFLASNYEGGLNVCSTTSSSCSFNPLLKPGFFHIEKDLTTDNLYWLGGNTGLYLYNTKGTLTTADDVITLAKDKNTDYAGEWVNEVNIFPGSGFVGEEIFVFSNMGKIRILETNNTPTDFLDDTNYVYSLPSQLYRNPFGVSSTFASKDQAWIFMPGTGLFNISLTRGFENNNVIEVLPSPPQGKLEVNHISLNSILGSNLTVGSVSLAEYFVSNNNGITWYPITIGERVDFPTSDYQLRFRAVLHPANGVTPVLTNVNLSYALYPDDPAIDPDLTLEYPMNTTKGSAFTGAVKFVDILGFTPNWNGQVNLQLVEANDQTKSSNCISHPDSLAVVNGTVDFNSTAVCTGEFVFKGQTIDGLISTVGHRIAITNVIVTPTATPTVIVNTEVQISNVRISNPVDNAINICWDTNIETVGMVSYGLKSINTLTNSTDLETIYKKLDHCVTLPNIKKTTDYLYQIKATSEAGKYATYDGDLAKKTEETTGDYTNCVAVDDKNISINTQNQVLLYFTTPTEMKCTTNYGNALSQNANSIISGFSTSHNPKLEISKTDGNKDIYYSISCITVDKVKNCSTKGIVPARLFTKPRGFFDNIAINTILPVTAIAGSLALGIFTSIGYPHWFLYSILIIKRRKKTSPWGVVFNLDNRTPLAFTAVKLYRKIDNKLIVQAISDLKGRYNIVADQGSYIVVVEDINFQRFSKEVEINNVEGAIILDIPLIPKLERRSIYKLQEKIRTVWGKIFTVIVLLGFIFSIIAFVLYQHWLNLLVFIAYLVQGYILLRVIYPKTWGVVYQGMNSNRLKGAFIRILDAKKGVQVDVQITDEKGRFYFWGEKDTSYLLKVDLLGYQLADKYKAEMVVTQSGESFLKCQYTKGNNLDLELIQST